MQTEMALEYSVERKDSLLPKPPSPALEFNPKGMESFSPVLARMLSGLRWVHVAKHPSTLKELNHPVGMSTHGGETFPACHKGRCFVKSAHLLPPTTPCTRPHRDWFCPAALCAVASCALERGFLPRTKARRHEGGAGVFCGMREGMNGRIAARDFALLWMFLCVAGWGKNALGIFVRIGARFFAGNGVKKRVGAACSRSLQVLKWVRAACSGSLRAFSGVLRSAAACFKSCSGSVRRSAGRFKC